MLIMDRLFNEAVISTHTWGSTITQFKLPKAHPHYSAPRRFFFVSPSESVVVPTYVIEGIKVGGAVLCGHGAAVISPSAWHVHGDNAGHI
jgi:hypothetical protein